MQVVQLRFARDIVEDDGDFLQLGRGERGAWLFIFPLEGLLAGKPASFFPLWAADCMHTASERADCSSSHHFRSLPS